MLNDSYFVDTGAWVALFDLNDQYHFRAEKFLSSIKGRHYLFFTSDYILDESITFIRRRIGHSAAIKFKNFVEITATIKLHLINAEIQSQAWDIFCKYSDHDFSFTDCTSFAFMQTMGLKKAFTFDKHFVIAGFEIFPV